MPTVQEWMRIGDNSVGAIGGRSGSMSQDLVKAMLMQGITSNEKMRAAFIKNGGGISEDKDGKIIANEAAFRSDAEKQVALQGYMKGKTERAKLMFQSAGVLGKQLNSMIKTLNGLKDPQNRQRQAANIDNFIKKKEYFGISNPLKLLATADFERMVSDEESWKNLKITSVLQYKEIIESGSPAVVNGVMVTPDSAVLGLQILGAQDSKLLDDMGVDIAEAYKKTDQGRANREKEFQVQLAEDRRKAQTAADIQAGKEMYVFRKKQAEGKPETWVTPEGQVVNLRPGEMPPNGSVPYSETAIGRTDQDTIDADIAKTEKEAEARSRGTVRGAMGATGIGKQPAKIQELIINAENIGGMLNQLEGMLSDIPAYSGPAARASGWYEIMKAEAGFADKVKLYKDFSDGILGRIARELGGERGVLTEQDVQRARKLVPRLTDTKNVRKMKLKALHRMLQTAKDTAEKMNRLLPREETSSTLRISPSGEISVDLQQAEEPDKSEGEKWFELNFGTRMD